VPDVTPPVISALSSSAVTASAAAISWTTNEPGDSQVEYGPTTSYGSLTALNATRVTAHLQSLSGLTAGTLYHYRARSRDVAGNLATSGLTRSALALDTTPRGFHHAPAAGTTVAGTVTVSASHRQRRRGRRAVPAGRRQPGRRG
jgi:hypothetical protein